MFFEDDTFEIIQVKYYPKTSPKMKEISTDLYYQYLRLQMLQSTLIAVPRLYIHTNSEIKELTLDKMKKNIELENMKVRENSIIDKVEIDGDYIHLGAGSDLSGIVNPKVSKYDSLDKIYKSLYSSTEENLDALRDILSMTYLGTHYGYNTSNEEQLKNLMSYLDSIYTGTPYSVSSELSRRSAGMFRDIATENQFKPELNKWLITVSYTHLTLPTT